MLKEAQMPKDQATAAVDPSVMIALFGTEDRALFASFLNKFVDEKNSEVVLALTNAINTGDMSAVVDNAHKLKSAARCIGASAFGDLCEFIEQTAKVGDLPEDRNLTREVENEFSDIRAFVDQY
jgi:HPt (histidine-containing phosphotransfer) domain-containing protein